ncbi:MMPL family transporter [Aeromicrobium sp.]|uniref:MMPL family transporter n=1 Tax=Aeromicrobium sp. TaxID=1871063 RepID=UPI002FCA349F
MSRILYRLGHFSGRHPWRILAAWIVVGVSVFMLNSSAGGSPDESFTIPGAESQRAADAVTDRFPQETVYTSNVIFHSDKGLDDPATKAAIEQTVTELAEGHKVVAVSSPYDPRGPTLSEDGKTAFATVAFDEDEIGAEQFEAAEKAAESAVDAGVQVEYDGGLGYAAGDAEPSSEKIGILVAIVVLAVAFGSLVALSIPIVTALFGLLIGVSSLGILSGFVAVPEIANIVGMMLGLGVGIDYALFILSRHRQNLDEGMTVPDAIGQANSSAGLSVLFAGITVIVAIAGLQVSGVPMMTVMGWASALMVAITMLAAITLLPAILGIVGKKVNAAKIPFIKQRPANDPSSGSARWAAKVVEHPVRYGVVATVILAVLAAPVFSMRLGFTDASNDGSSTTTRKAFDLVADAYGPGTNGPFQIVVETNDAADADAAVDRVAEALAADKGVASVEQPTFNEGKDLAMISVTPTSAPQDAETSDTLHRLRDSVLPDAVGDSKVEAMVTGGTAMSEDVSNRLQDRMPWFLGAVIGLSFLVLMLVFRSVLVPLKAAVLNMLSVGAAYGVIVAVFQWGWAANLIGVEGSVPIMPLAPMLMFAILFGLSMDYEVFLLSRVREQFMRHGNAKKALVEGVASTGRVITSAALIMISVFASFILMSDVTAKMFGVGLAVAVLLDVTLVRMVLVPAAMSLLGDRAWWLPNWLDRLLPSIDLEGGYVDNELTDEDERLLEEDAQVLV